MGIDRIGVGIRGVQFHRKPAGHGHEAATGPNTSLMLLGKEVVIGEIDQGD